MLVGFVVVVVREIGATLEVWPGGEGDPYELFAVSLTGLVGGVFAVALAAPRQVETRRVAIDRLRSHVGRAYVVAYALAGGIALVVCLVRLGSSTALLRSLAATFLGTSVAAASAFFGVEADER
jgi:hypothetical protein